MAMIAATEVPQNAVEELGYWGQRRATGMAANPYTARSWGGHKPAEEAAWNRGQNMAIAEARAA